MAMFKAEPVRPPHYQRFARPVPQWFADAKFGIFVHWGPYSVPAWAEPIGELGTIERSYWFAHNPYAEWYYNTIRLAGSPASEHHAAVHRGVPYDSFLDDWRAESFNAADLLQLVASSGARYFIPTTKHHDGVTLWDAPGTGGRNTVVRGPQRDLVRELERATREAGLRFGVYYSGGLDWHFSQLPPIGDGEAADTRPVDEAYARYAYNHVEDLISRYQPDVLWGDIEWPDAGKPEGPFSMARLFEQFYGVNPEGVSNDRWGETHWDYRTSEYQEGLSVETGKGAWENCRGIGYSFGFNRLEDERQLLNGKEAVTLLVDIVSRGGNLLLNIGLTAGGEVPELQRRTLQTLGEWNRSNGAAVFGSQTVSADLACPSDDPWMRWTRSGQTLFGIFDCHGRINTDLDVDRVDLRAAQTMAGRQVSVTSADGVVTFELEPATLPTVVSLPII